MPNQLLAKHLQGLTILELGRAEEANKRALSFFSGARKVKSTSIFSNVIKRKWSLHMHRRKLIIKEKKRRGLE